MSRLVVSPRGRALIPACLLVGALMTVWDAPTAAQALESDIAQDSELTLIERSDAGAYQRFSIRLTMSQGAVRLTTDKDGVRNAVDLPAEEALALWRELLAGGFSAYGVDSLSDKRYREIVRAILKTADKPRQGEGGAL